MNVTDLIVKNDYCIGCGVCAGICPVDNLCMDWSNKGELIPFSSDSCSSKCSLCLEVCPFNNQDINQDDIALSLFSKVPDINYHQYTGYYLDCYVGFQKDDQKRLKSASGGLATSFLVSLLENEIVDRIVAVGTSQNSNLMFDFKILNDPDEVYSCAGSAYYPVEISRVLKQILTEKEEYTYAVIALPCVAYALRLAQKKIPKLKRKIKIIASLTCGQLQNRFCTELLALESGIKVDELSKMDFRRKIKKNLASNFAQVAIDNKGNEGKPLECSRLPFHLWHYHYFKQNACNYCDDIFGELADVTFMDAWLPDYIKNYKGTSLAIVRTEISKKVLESLNYTTLNNIFFKNVIDSQMGCIRKKRYLLKGRIYQKEIKGLFFPKTRVGSDKEIYNKNREFMDLTFKIQNLSKKKWKECRLDSSTTNFWEELKSLESKIVYYETKSKLKTLINLPNRFIKLVIGGKNDRI